MNDPHRFFVVSFTHVVLWRLVNGEESKPNNELDQGYSSHNDNEVSPSHILRPRADLCLGAGEITKDWPCDQSSHNLRQRPIDG